MGNFWIMSLGLSIKRELWDRAKETFMGTVYRIMLNPEEIWIECYFV